MPIERDATVAAELLKQDKGAHYHVSDFEHHEGPGHRR